MIKEKNGTRKFFLQSNSVCCSIFLQSTKMADHMVTVERECIEIQQDIKRLGEVKDGKHTVKFGILYDDDKVNYCCEFIF